MFTRDQAKNLVKLMPIIKAFADGEQVRVYGGRDVGWLSFERHEFKSPPESYRVVPATGNWAHRVKHEPIGANGVGDLWEVKDTDGERTLVRADGWKTSELGLKFLQGNTIIAIFARFVHFKKVCSAEELEDDKGEWEGDR